jgi:hypothetical protein
MPRITVQDADTWCEKTKLNIAVLEAGLVEQLETQVLGRLTPRFGTTVTDIWVDAATTPRIIRSVIAMFYVAWYYDRQYSEDQEEGNDYAALLRASAESLLVGILDGSIVLPEVPNAPEPGSPAFYPTDESSALEPTIEDPSLGPAVFSLGTKF